MRLAMCNEFCQGWSIGDTFRLAAETGYQGVEIAPFTLAASVDEVTEATRKEIRDAARQTGVDVVGLHWLLAKTEGLHITHPEKGPRDAAAEYLIKLIDLCADLGGNRMVFGSPMQRNVMDGQTFDDCWKRAIDVFQKVLPRCAQHDVVLCIEPLARTETNFITSKDQGVQFVEDVDHPNLKLILDCKAMSDEDKPIAQLVKEAAEVLEHFHLNDDSKSYPGTGTLDFTSIMAALTEIDYQGWASLEVFDFSPPPQQIAAEGFAHVQAALSGSSTAG
jgi:sugar phosphate isomerase/epimerase